MQRMMVIRKLDTTNRTRSSDASLDEYNFQESFLKIYHAEVSKFFYQESDYSKTFVHVLRRRGAAKILTFEGNRFEKIQESQDLDEGYTVMIEAHTTFALVGTFDALIITYAR